MGSARLTSQPSAPPVYCRPEAYAYFMQQLPELSTTKGLLHAAIALSMHALDDVDPQRVEDRLQAIATRIRDRVKSGNIDGLVAHLHDVLFGEEAFAGNTDHFYVALNSYIPVVLDTKRGLPISLSLIYKVVGEFAGLSIEGINAPGHFMARVRCSKDWMIVDPFFCGQPLNQEEAFERMMNSIQREIPWDDSYLAAATHRQWIARMLANLQSLFASEGRLHDLRAMKELQRALRASDSAT